MMTPEELHTRRRRLKLTQKELGALLGVSPITISSWECGDSSFPSMLLEKALKYIEFEISLGSEQFAQLYSRLSDLPANGPLPDRVRRSNRILKDAEAEIRAAVAARPDLTLSALCQLVKATNGASVSTMTMGRELKRLHLVTQRCSRRSMSER
jgi:transcriptional regulator with XRE-family HTH domain